MLMRGARRDVRILATGGGVLAGERPPGQAPPCGIKRLFMHGPLGRKAGELLPVSRGMIHMAQVAQLMPAQVLQQRGRQKEGAPVEADASFRTCRRKGCVALGKGGSGVMCGGQGRGGKKVADARGELFQ